jgi:hypothetical protein
VKTLGLQQGNLALAAQAAETKMDEYADIGDLPPVEMAHPAEVVRLNLHQPVGRKCHGRGSSD